MASPIGQKIYPNITFEHKDEKKVTINSYWLKRVVPFQITTLNGDISSQIVLDDNKEDDFCVIQTVKIISPETKNPNPAIADKHSSELTKSENNTQEKVATDDIKAGDYVMFTDQSSSIKILIEQYTQQTYDEVLKTAYKVTEVAFPD